MRNRAVVSERGTVTIPEPIREAVHIHPGDLIEFYPRGDQIILKHLVVKSPKDESFMSDNEWDKFDRLVHRQLKRGQFKGYSDLKQAKLHSHKLLRKK